MERYWQNTTANTSAMKKFIVNLIILAVTGPPSPAQTIVENVHLNQSQTEVLMDIEHEVVHRSYSLSSDTVKIYDLATGAFATLVFNDDHLQYFQTIESYNNTGYEELQKIKRNRRRYSRMCPDLVHFECYSDKKSYVEKLVHKSSTEEEGYIITTLTFPLDKHEIITTVLRSRLY